MKFTNSSNRLDNIDEAVVSAAASILNEAAETVKKLPVNESYGFWGTMVSHGFGARNEVPAIWKAACDAIIDAHKSTIKSWMSKIGVKGDVLLGCHVYLNSKSGRHFADLVSTSDDIYTVMDAIEKAIWKSGFKRDLISVLDFHKTADDLRKYLK